MALNFGLATVLRYAADLLMKPSHKALEDAMGSWRAEVQYACVKAGTFHRANHLPDMSNFRAKHVIRDPRAFEYGTEDAGRVG